MSISRLVLNGVEKCLRIELDTFKSPLKFHYFWLRDHCRCDNCFNKITNQVQQDILKIPRNVEIVDVNRNDDMLNVKWDDGHESQFLLSALLELYNRQERDVAFWDKNNFDYILKNVTITKDEYFKNDGCKKLLSNILKYGFAFVTNVGCSMEATQEVSEHVASAQKTYFGEMWEVTNNYLHKDTAYTTISLGAHNDNTYFTNAAGLQIFHMLKHDGSGGETLLVDGFNVANNLKKKDENSFNILCTKPIESFYKENERYFTNIDTVIKVHPVTKQLQQIRYNIYDRDVLNTLHFDEIMSFYDAYRMFGDEINKPVNEAWIKLQPGSVCFIDNWRILHGRASYTGLRQLVGCYLSRDDWLSRAKGLGLQIY